MRIFLDVGAHYGETLDVALNPKWGFHTVHCFEPASSLVYLLEKFHDKRVVIHPFGLAAESRDTILFGAGLLGASIYSQKKFLDSNSINVTEAIKLKKFSDWLLENTEQADELYLKMNCEGSEVDILENLISSGLFSRISSIYVDFDIRKVPGQEYRQVLIEKKLDLLSVSLYTPDSLGLSGTMAVEKWLSLTLEEIEVDPLKQIVFNLGLYLPFYLHCRKIVFRFAPKILIKMLVRKYGLHSKRNFK